MKLQTLISAADNLLINRLIPLMMGLALLAFFWGLFKSLAGGGDEKAVAAGRNVAVWGLVALFVMASVWGLVHFIQNGLDIRSLTI